MPKRKVWVDSKGNRYHRSLESVTKKCRLSGTRILVRRVYEMDEITAEAVCLDHGKYMTFNSMTHALHHSSVPEWCEFCCHKMWDECGPFCNVEAHYPYEDCKLDATSGDIENRGELFHSCDWLFDEEETKIGKRYSYELIGGANDDA